MKISIVTVSFNSAATIGRTIASVRSQTHTAVEYIVVDGASTDGTSDIIAAHSDAIDRWVSEKDRGLYDAMNKGIAMASGDLVGILNSDDEFYDDRVLARVAQFHTDNDIDASVGDVVQHNTQGRVLRRYSAARWQPEALGWGFMPPHPAMFIRRSLFERHGHYRLDFKIGADYELIVRYFLKNKIRWKYSGIATTRMLIGGLSSSGLRSYATISNEISRALRQNGIPHSAIRVRLRGL